MNMWEAYHKYVENFENKSIQKIQIGARINGLCKKGLLYKSKEQIREERGALNNVFKLFPQEGFPDDFEMSTLEIIKVPLKFGDNGFPDAEATKKEFEIKLQKKLKEYGAN